MNIHGKTVTLKKLKEAQYVWRIRGGHEEEDVGEVHWTNSQGPQ